MNDAEIKHATCQVICGKDSGTGWLATPARVVTARHCVLDAISEGSPIRLRFEADEGVEELDATVVANDDALDACVLLLSRELDRAPVPVDDAPPVAGNAFSAFGYPVVKLTVGHRLEGSISQVLDQPRQGIDLDLHVDAAATLTNYRGISGAPLIVGDRCRGMLRIAVDNPVGAISSARLAEFLRRNSIPVGKAADIESDGDVLAPRDAFSRTLESKIKATAGGYAFIEGAHGIGKTTFCHAYRPLDPSLEHFGTYSFTSQRGAVNAMHLAQPDEFFAWLNTLVSARFTGRARRASEKRHYAEIIKETDRLLTSLGQAYLSQERIGVLFVDGLDEVAKLGAETLERFTGLLPSKCPAGLAIVISAPSYLNVAAALGTRVEAQSCIAMPPLVRSVARAFCEEALSAERASAETIRIICERAEGHPLYLRYLVDLANGGADDAQLAGLPLINGRIQIYYEALWAGLLNDPEAVNLLAIVARLRWGIPIKQLVDMLTGAEQAVLVNTIARIQHLLLERDETTIYHSSFAEFLIEKTALREGDVQRRLLAYCTEHPKTHYGTLNGVYHGLRSGAAHEPATVAGCNQTWVDRCVTLGAEPDALLGDLDDTLAAATREGSLVEVVRILLLAQRLQFRYDTLFAQSADLAASALLSLGKTWESLRHAVRYGHLIIPVPDALRLAHELNERNESGAALDLLDKADAAIDRVLSEQEIKIGEFIGVVELRIQLLLLRHRAGDDDARSTLRSFYVWALQNIRSSVADEKHRVEIANDMVGRFGASRFYLAAQYTAVSALRERAGTAKWLDQILLQMVTSIRAYRGLYGLTPDQGGLELLFADLSALLVELGDKWDKPDLGTIDSFVSLGAPIALIRVLSEGRPTNVGQPRLIADDGVSVDERRLVSEMAQWRLAAIVDQDLLCPDPEAIEGEEGWAEAMELVCAALAWCDGAARRAKGNGNEDGRRAVWALMEQRVLARLRFTLAQRASWEGSYAIPEAWGPVLYEHLARLVADVYPERICDLTAFIDERFAEQCGLYNEGFRSVLAKVLSLICTVTADEAVSDQVLALLKRWKDYVQANVKNRHELVPELLTIIPLLVRCNAPEEAHRAYQAVLANSMGPSWYKEDQLSLMTGAMKHIPREEPLGAGTISGIAGNLEAAGGEMTFQRFVRYDKAELAGILCQRGDHLGAVRYFLRQTCGTPEQLLSEATAGSIDRVSPLRGIRFPGGALDEQDALYRMLEMSVPSAHWPLCWALLEVYQFGDRRHVERSAEAYARMAAQAQEQAGALALISDRLRILLESEIEDEERQAFLFAFRQNLPAKMLESFKEIVGEEPSSKEAAESAAPPDITDPAESSPGVEQGDGQEHSEWPEDAVFMAGTFGSQISSRESKEALSRAERQLARGNTSAARAEALTALQCLQRGGWSIWGNHSGEATRAEDILRLGAESGSSVVKQYAPLILNERYADKWRRADHLIERVASIVTQDERAAVLRQVVEHVGIIIGGAAAEAAEYGFLEESRQEDASSSLIELLVAAIDHPQWIRREKAAELIRWLFKHHPQYVREIGPKGFTMESGNHPDVLCGALDLLSLSNPIWLWNELSAALNLEGICSNCKHAGRLAVLLRIMDRAAKAGSTEAAEALEVLRTAVGPVTESESSTRNPPVDCPTWALGFEPEWRELAAMGVATQELVDRATGVIQDACAPLSIETSIELERLLAEGFNENPQHKLGRWRTKVRYALQVALLPVSSVDALFHVEQTFRPYNPSPIDHLRVVGFASPGMDWIRELEQGGGGFQPMDGDDVYLDYLERIWDRESHRYRLFRMTAFFHTSGSRPSPPKKQARFLSTENPEPKAAPMPQSCARVRLAPAFFGSFTPAVPSPEAMQVIGLNDADVARAHWRRGRASPGRGGHFEREGCFLAVKRAALWMPADIEIAWIYEIDGRPAGIVSRAA